VFRTRQKRICFYLNCIPRLLCWSTRLSMPWTSDFSFIFLRTIPLNAWVYGKFGLRILPWVGSTAQEAIKLLEILHIFHSLQHTYFFQVYSELSPGWSGHLELGFGVHARSSVKLKLMMSNKMTSQVLAVRSDLDYVIVVTFSIPIAYFLQTNVKTVLHHIILSPLCLLAHIIHRTF